MNNIRVTNGLDLVHTEAYEATRLIPNLVEQPIDPALRMDIFRFTAPAFFTHPHAGYTTLTYIFPESKGHIHCLSSIASPLDIKAGEALWCSSGKGMVHDEIPVTNGGDVIGLQLFVNLPRANEISSPRQCHILSSDHLNIPIEGGTLRLICGSYLDQSVGIFGLSYALIQFQIDQSTQIKLPEGWSAMGYLESGKAKINNSNWASSQFFSILLESQLTIECEGPISGLIFMGEPLQEPLHWRGPFAMSSSLRLNAARKAYSMGLMGEVRN